MARRRKAATLIAALGEADLIRSAMPPVAPRPRRREFPKMTAEERADAIRRANDRATTDGVSLVDALRQEGVI